MLLPVLKTLAEEQVVLLGRNAKKLPFHVRGITRLVDARGKTLGVVIDKRTLDEFEEELEAQNPGFLSSLEASRKSGRVSATAVKRKAHLS